MANNAVLPEIINNFYAYKNGNRMIGVTGEISLAEFQNMTATVSGAGVLGEYETAIIGAFSSMVQEIPFRILDDDIFSLANPMELIELTLRASEQYTVKATCEIQFKGMRIVMRGRPKSFKPGTLKRGGTMDANVSLELMYILIEIDGKKKIELDKINEIYIVNEVDIMKIIKDLC